MKIRIGTTILLFLIVIGIGSCKKQSKQEEEIAQEWTGAYTETKVYEGLLPIDISYLGIASVEDKRYGLVFLCSQTISNVLITEKDRVERDYYPWRLPTRKEADVMKGIDIGDTDDTRYLCFDKASNTYYTFRFGTGNVTKAGSKTKYKIKPIRTIYTTDSIIIEL